MILLGRASWELNNIEHVPLLLKREVGEAKIYIYSVDGKYKPKLYQKMRGRGDLTLTVPESLGQCLHLHTHRTELLVTLFHRTPLTRRHLTGCNTKQLPKLTASIKCPHTLNNCIKNSFFFPQRTTATLLLTAFISYKEGDSWMV